MDSLPCLNSKIFYFWNKQQIQNWGVEQFPGKQNERESFSPSKIEKYNRYKDKIIFSLEFNIWKLRRWIEFRSAILIFVLHVEIYTPINILASWRSSLCYCTRTTVIANLILIRTFWINLLIIFENNFYIFVSWKIYKAVVNICDTWNIFKKNEIKW